MSNKKADIAELTKDEIKALVEAAITGIQRCWVDWVDSGEAEELGVTKRMLSHAESAVNKLGGKW